MASLHKRDATNAPIAQSRSMRRCPALNVERRKGEGCRLRKARSRIRVRVAAWCDFSWQGLSGLKFRATCVDNSAPYLQKQPNGKHSRRRLGEIQHCKAIEENEIAPQLGTRSPLFDQRWRTSIGLWTPFGEPGLPKMTPPILQRRLL